MQSKLPSYPLAAYPILAILLAKFLHESVPNVWIQRVFYFALAQTLLLHLLVAPILNEKRKDTQVLAKSWKQSLTKTEAIYSFKNYALPSLAFYLDTQIQVVADFLEFQSLPKGSIVLIDLDNYMLLSQWGKGYKVLSEAKSVWAYDRNKTIQLLLIQID
ncbi:dolichyl-phosphate-mannose-protein mannosyltransferase [Leptospira ryugenii]|uniref:Dolichyl-phosphate-mannose-protein mannosyltransferase n=2 Tax=Leptospira ryugenii TaxID=1917863 RepID=A0A2P2E0Z8_9LEPT|nr:dolichyl-phosphate-mannose-protein mannosyltransferase [Leptospira ryugenii]